MNDIEKARAKHNVGDIHPNGKWMWVEYKPGQFAWRTIKKPKGGAKPATKKPAAKQDDDDTTKKQPAAPVQKKPVTKKQPAAPAQPKQPVTAKQPTTPPAGGGQQPVQKRPGSRTKMTPEQLEDWAKNTTEQNLLKIANNKTGKASLRMLCYNELKRRGYDVSKVDISGTLEGLMKMSEKPKEEPKKEEPKKEPEKPKSKKKSKAEEELEKYDDAEDGEDGDDSGITEQWYLNPNDERVKKKFNLKTKAGRIKYDQFMDKMKRAEPDYMPPQEIIENMNEQYLEFIDNPEQRFMISAGGAGVGKSYGFEKLAEFENCAPFQEGDTPGDDNYDYFMAPEVNSVKQLLQILKAHNGKIIVFDDFDKALTRKDTAGVMKRATASTGKRVIGDPDDIKSNFEFTGRILVMTNKDLIELADNEDTKAVISRAMLMSDIHLSVSEQVELMEKRYQDYEFKQTPRLDDPEEDKKERDEIMQLIKDNIKNIDPKTFSTRMFQRCIVEKRKSDNANKKRQRAEIAGLIGSKQKDWKKEVIKNVLSKAETEGENTIGVAAQVMEKAGKSEKSQKRYRRAADDGVNYEIDLQKAEEMLLSGRIEDDGVLFKAYDDMSVDEAEEILFK